MSEYICAKMLQALACLPAHVLARIFLCTCRSYAVQFPEQGYHCTRGNKGQLSAGRKHQLRKACANVLHAPILGDGRYALLRSPEQLWFQERL